MTKKELKEMILNLNQRVSKLEQRLVKERNVRDERINLLAKEMGKMFVEEDYVESNNRLISPWSGYAMSITNKTIKTRQVLKNTPESDAIEKKVNELMTDIEDSLSKVGETIEKSNRSRKNKTKKSNKK